MSALPQLSGRERDRVLLSRLERQCSEASHELDPDRPPPSTVVVGLFLPDLQRLLVMARLGLIARPGCWVTPP